MKAWVIVFIMSCMSSPSLATEVLALDYEELQHIILKNNKAVHARSESVEAAKQRVGTLDRTFYPKAGFEVGVAEQKEANGIGDTAPFWKIDVQSNLYRGGRDNVGQLLRQSQVLIKEMDAQAFSRSQVFHAKIQYVQLAMVRQVKGLTRGTVDDYENLRKSITRKAQAGLMTLTAAHTIQLQLDGLKRQMIEIDDGDRELEDRLALTLGLEPENPLRLQTLFSAASLKVPVLDIDNLNRLPEIKRLDLLSESARMETQTRNEWWLPDVNVFASYTTFQVERGEAMRSLPARDLSLGVRLSIDLDAKSTFDAERRARNRDRLALDLEKERVQQEIAHALHEYQREMNTQQKLIQEFDQSLKKAERLVTQLKTEFERGIGSSGDITSTLASIYEMKRKRLESLSSFFLARAGLESMVYSHEGS